MANTILVEGLPLCHAGSGGIATASSPDVCNTVVGIVVVPIPYPNIAKDEDLVDGSETVLADGGMSIAIEGSKLSKSTGDESGSIGGISSGIIQGEAEFTSFGSTVMIEGKPCVRHTDTLTMNKQNTVCMGGIVVPPVNAVAVTAEGSELQTFFELKLIDYEGKPIPNENYQVINREGEIAAEGTLDDAGYAIVDNLPKDLYHANYPDINTDEIS
ncbi:MAG: DUF4150 domain-containing protein [Desulfobacterales bacterium]|nr:DUF4150 domain-containing protein [Desulfobacterales bacterium]MCP4162691.1 DUF4150 domain-containing protein [Deltaproteobacteria bacterium]